MVWRWRHTPRTVQGDNWITREFTKRGLTPPYCTPEALAQALERERQITITFRAHLSGDPGVYGLLCRSEDDERAYVIVFRASHSIVLRRLTLFHELAHLMFDHRFDHTSEIGRQIALRCALVSNANEAQAEAFAIGAMHYSFTHTVPVPQAHWQEDVSAFGRYLKRTAYWP